MLAVSSAILIADFVSIVFLWDNQLVAVENCQVKQILGIRGLDGNGGEMNVVRREDQNLGPSVLALVTVKPAITEAGVQTAGITSQND
jgi:hypothetical protein